MSDEKFKSIINEYEKLIFTVCYQFVRDYQEAQNLTQETFLSAYKCIDNCSSGSYKPWLIRIASNKAKDYLKSAYKKHVILNSEDSEANEVYSINPLTTEDEFLSEENLKKIHSIINSLKEPYLKVSQMFFIDELTYEEISFKLNRPKKTVQTQILRAKEILKKILKEGE